MNRSTVLLILAGVLLLGGGGAALYTMTRGLRNNNPGNIRDDGTDWEGVDTPRNDGTYLRFISPAYGIRAMARVLSNYVNTDGVSPTVDAIISRWAPPTENNTAAYVMDVAGDVGVDPDQPFDLPSVLPALVAAIIQHENGLNPYDSATIAQGIALA